MHNEMIAELILMMAINALKIWERYKLSGRTELELDPYIIGQLKIFSRRAEILKYYGVDIEEIDRQIAEHEAKLQEELEKNEP